MGRRSDKGPVELGPLRLVVKVADFEQERDAARVLPAPIVTGTRALAGENLEEVLVR